MFEFQTKRFLKELVVDDSTTLAGKLFQLLIASPLYKEMSSTVVCSMWFVDLILVAPSDIRCLIFEEVVNINIKVLVSQLVRNIISPL